jgi:hypothetical protein
MSNTSSVIKTINHNGGDVLTVEFQNGARYNYPGISSEVAAAFAAAPSKGYFFNTTPGLYSAGVPA